MQRHRPPKPAAASASALASTARRRESAAPAPMRTAMDPELLINEVYARPPLWDRSSPAHSNRDVVAGLWKEVADACGISCDVAKSKWKHLRDHFRCELKRCLKTRQGRAGRYRSTWVWFWPLLFLKEQMLQPRHRESLDDSPAEEELSVPAGDDPVISEVTTIKSEPGADRPACKRRRNSGLDPELLDLDRRNQMGLDDQLKPAGSSLTSDPFDDTEHFLLSLAPALRTLQLSRQLVMRLKIQELVTKEVLAAAEECPARSQLGGLGGHSIVETALEIPDIEAGWAQDADVGVEVVGSVENVTDPQSAWADDSGK